MTTTDSCNEIITLTAINEMYKKINHTLIYYMYLTKKFNYFYFYWNPQANSFDCLYLKDAIKEMSQLSKLLYKGCFILKTLLVLLADNLHMVQVCLVMVELWYCGIPEKGLWWLTFWQHKQRISPKTCSGENRHAKKILPENKNLSPSPQINCSIFNPMC